MSRQYCFKLDKPLPDNDPDLIENLKEYVKSLYKSLENPTLMQVIYVPSDSSVCTILTKKTKAFVQEVEAIHEQLRKQKLSWNGIELSPPEEFVVEPVKWWIEDTTGVRWTSLQHKGPYFTHLLEPYEPLGASLEYNSIEYPLTPKEEQLASFYAKRLILENNGTVVDLWTQDKVFNQNFWRSFQKYLTKEHKAIFKIFNKISFQNIIDKINARKNIENPDEKVRKRVRTEEKKREYGYAIVDGNREKIGNYIIEPSAIFYGRGDNPNRGKIKQEINPEDVTINIGLSDPVPKPPLGHRWKEVIHDQNAVWLAKWNDSITGDIKYMMLSMEGRFKGQGDLSKYEKARKLEKEIEKIRKKYTKDINSRDIRKRQLGTVLYLIDNLGIRVGNEKKEDEADTIGATTLRVENIEFENGNVIVFDFLGKDSIRFYKKFVVPPIVYKNFEQFVRGKQADDDVFDKIKAVDINTYLKDFNKDFSAKVFRTRLASEIMYNALRDVHIPEHATKQMIKLMFNKANALVADVLNHTRNVSKKAQETVKVLEGEQKELEQTYKRATKSEKPKIQKKLDNIRAKIEAKTDVMTVAINTSLANYIDPRLVFAWIKQQHIDPASVYSATLLKKFMWANEMTQPEWDWLTSPVLPDNKQEGITIIEDVYGPGTIEDYQAILDFCQDNTDALNNVSIEVLEWLYPLCEYAIRQGKATQKCRELVDWYRKSK